jgi:hypothetical protein
MKWFDKWMYKQTKKAWENKNRFEMEEESKMIRSKQMAMNMGTIGVAQVERSRPEGEGRITFELSHAVGGKILNVRHYDERKDRHDHQTYVIPSGEDIGERVAKIVNLEMFKL